MRTLTTNDGTGIYLKDWGPRNAQPVVFHHNWPLSSDDRLAQTLYFVGKAYRVVARDRRSTFSIKFVTKPLRARS